MKLTKQEFLDQPKKAISLIGMSGVGKSHWSSQLETWGWTNYSCDYLIASEYLSDQVEGAVSADNIVNLSSFVGQIGDPSKGGVALEEFQRRQKMYYDAECSVLRDVPAALEKAEGHFVNDSSGSLCEVEDQAILEAVGQKTLFVYLRVRQADHAEILERAIQYPKPLFFPSSFFEERLERFQKKFEIERVEDIDPNVFLSWVFPHLFESRLPKYKALADQYGVTLSTGALAGVTSEEEFIGVIAEALDE